MRDYSPTTAIELAQAAARTYDPTITHNILRVIEGEVGCALITYTGSILTVAFRGTRPLHFDDWWHDAEAWHHPVVLRGVSCAVHAGFWQSLQEVQELVDEAVARIPHDALVVTGHSLGGAMAAQWVAGRRDVDALYTFGQPRAGDAAFATLLRDMPYFRIVNDRDVVPHVPLTLTHGGKLGWIDHAGVMTWPADDPFRLDVLENVDDHEIEHYISLLERNA